MPVHKPLYLYSLKEAAEWNEKDEWRESYLENCDCARAIERAIDEHYDGERLCFCANEVIEKYGFDRVNFVLAATVASRNFGRKIFRGQQKIGQGVSLLWTRKTHGNTMSAATPDLLIFLLPTQDDYGIGSDYLTAAIAKMKAAIGSTIPTGYWC